MTAAAAASPSDVTDWRLKQIEDGQKLILDKLDDRPDWKDVRTIESGLLDRVKRLEDWQTWAVRIVIAAVIVGVIGVWVSGGK